jgi:hypothetical protein
MNWIFNRLNRAKKNSAMEGTQWKSCNKVLNEENQSSRKGDRELVNWRILSKNLRRGQLHLVKCNSSAYHRVNGHDYTLVEK